MTTHLLYHGYAHKNDAGEYAMEQTLDVEYFCDQFCYNAATDGLVLQHGYIEREGGQFVGGFHGVSMYDMAEGGAHPAPEWPDYAVDCGFCQDTLWEGREID